jgi:hypothetical protein
MFPEDLLETGTLRSVNGFPTPGKAASIPPDPKNHPGIWSAKK